MGLGGELGVSGAGRVGVHWKQILGYRVSWAACVKSWPYIHTHTDTLAVHLRVSVGPSVRLLRPC